MYRVNFGLWSGVFAVPNEIVDNHLKLCGYKALQVLLLLLRSGRPMEPEEVAGALGQTLNDITDALTYWVNAGVILEGAQVQFASPAVPIQAGEPIKEAEPTVAVIEEPLKEATPIEVPDRKIKTDRFVRMTKQDIIDSSQTDETVGFLIQESQEVLGRILSNRETESIVGLYCNYHIQPDIVLMLLHYCKTVSKDSIAYIERMGVDWVNREINTHERAEAELMRLSSQGEKEGKVREIFGIHNRGITKKEVEYYTAWAEDMKMTEHMIKLAYERTIDIHGQTNFAYTNAILVNWYRDNIVTPEQAIKAQKEREETTEAKQGARPQKAGEPNASYDIDKVEKMLDFGSIWD